MKEQKNTIESLFMPEGIEDTANHIADLEAIRTLLTNPKIDDSAFEIKLEPLDPKEGENEMGFGLLERYKACEEITGEVYGSTSPSDLNNPLERMQILDLVDAFDESGSVKELEAKGTKAEFFTLTKAKNSKEIYIQTPDGNTVATLKTKSSLRERLGGNVEEIGNIIAKERENLQNLHALDYARDAFVARQKEMFKKYNLKTTVEGQRDGSSIIEFADSTTLGAPPLLTVKLGYNGRTSKFSCEMGSVKKTSRAEPTIPTVEEMETALLQAVKEERARNPLRNMYPAAEAEAGVKDKPETKPKKAAKAVKTAATAPEEQPLDHTNASTGESFREAEAEIAPEEQKKIAEFQKEIERIFNKPNGGMPKEIGEFKLDGEKTPNGYLLTYKDFTTQEPLIEVQFQYIKGNLFKEYRARIVSKLTDTLLPPIPPEDSASEIVMRVESELPSMLQDHVENLPEIMKARKNVTARSKTKKEEALETLKPVDAAQAGTKKNLEEEMADMEENDIGATPDQVSEEEAKVTSLIKLGADSFRTELHKKNAELFVRSDTSDPENPTVVLMIKMANRKPLHGIIRKDGETEKFMVRVYRKEGSNPPEYTHDINDSKYAQQDIAGALSALRREMTSIVDSPLAEVALGEGGAETEPETESPETGPSVEEMLTALPHITSIKLTDRVIRLAELGDTTAGMAQKIKDIISSKSKEPKAKKLKAYGKRLVSPLQYGLLFKEIVFNINGTDFRWDSRTGFEDGDFNEIGAKINKAHSSVKAEKDKEEAERKARADAVKAEKEAKKKTKEAAKEKAQKEKIAKREEAQEKARENAAKQEILVAKFQKEIKKFIKETIPQNVRMEGRNTDDGYLATYKYADTEIVLAEVEFKVLLGGTYKFLLRESLQDQKINKNPSYQNENKEPSTLLREIRNPLTVSLTMKVLAVKQSQEAEKNKEQIHGLKSNSGVNAKPAEVAETTDPTKEFRKEIDNFLGQPNLTHIANFDIEKSEIPKGYLVTYKYPGTDIALAEVKFSTLPEGRYGALIRGRIKGLPLNQRPAYFGSDVVAADTGPELIRNLEKKLMLVLAEQVNDVERMQTAAAEQPPVETPPAETATAEQPSAEPETKDLLGWVSEGAEKAKTEQETLKQKRLEELAKIVEESGTGYKIDPHSAETKQKKIEVPIVDENNNLKGFIEAFLDSSTNPEIKVFITNKRTRMKGETPEDKFKKLKETNEILATRIAELKKLIEGTGFELDTEDYGISKGQSPDEHVLYIGIKTPDGKVKGNIVDWFDKETRNPQITIYYGEGEKYEEPLTDNKEQVKELAKIPGEIQKRLAEFRTLLKSRGLKLGKTKIKRSDDDKKDLYIRAEILNNSGEVVGKIDDWLSESKTRSIGILNKKGQYIGEGTTTEILDKLAGKTKEPATEEVADEGPTDEPPIEPPPIKPLPITETEPASAEHTPPALTVAGTTTGPAEILPIPGLTRDLRGSGAREQLQNLRKDVLASKRARYKALFGKLTTTKFSVDRDIGRMFEGKIVKNWKNFLGPKAKIEEIMTAPPFGLFKEQVPKELAKIMTVGRNDVFEFKDIFNYLKENGKIGAGIELTESMDFSGSKDILETCQTLLAKDPEDLTEAEATNLETIFSQLIVPTLDLLHAMQRLEYNPAKMKKRAKSLEHSPEQKGIRDSLKTLCEFNAYDHQDTKYRKTAFSRWWSRWIGAGVLDGKEARSELDMQTMDGKRVRINEGLFRRHSDPMAAFQSLTNEEGLYEKFTEPKILKPAAVLAKVKELMVLGYTNMRLASKGVENAPAITEKYPTSIAEFQNFTEEQMMAFQLGYVVDQAGEFDAQIQEAREVLVNTDNPILRAILGKALQSGMSPDEIGQIHDKVSAVLGGKMNINYKNGKYEGTSFGGVGGGGMIKVNDHLSVMIGGGTDFTAGGTNIGVGLNIAIYKNDKVALSVPITLDLKGIGVGFTGSFNLGSTVLTTTVGAKWGLDSIIPTVGGGVTYKFENMQMKADKKLKEANESSHYAELWEAWKDTPNLDVAQKMAKLKEIAPAWEAAQALKTKVKADHGLELTDSQIVRMFDMVKEQITEETLKDLSRFFITSVGFYQYGTVSVPTVGFHIGSAEVFIPVRREIAKQAERLAGTRAETTLRRALAEESGGEGSVLTDGSKYVEKTPQVQQLSNGSIGIIDERETVDLSKWQRAGETAEAATEIRLEAANTIVKKDPTTGVMSFKAFNIEDKDTEFHIDPALQSLVLYKDAHNVSIDGRTTDLIVTRLRMKTPFISEQGGSAVRDIIYIAQKESFEYKYEDEDGNRTGAFEWMQDHEQAYLEKLMGDSEFEVQEGLNLIRMSELSEEDRTRLGNLASNVQEAGPETIARIEAMTNVSEKRRQELLKQVENTMEYFKTYRPEVSRERMTTANLEQMGTDIKARREALKAFSAKNMDIRAGFDQTLDNLYETKLRKIFETKASKRADTYIDNPENLVKLVSKNIDNLSDAEANKAVIYLLSKWFSLIAKDPRNRKRIKESLEKRITFVQNKVLLPKVRSTWAKMKVGSDFSSPEAMVDRMMEDTYGDLRKMLKNRNFNFDNLSTDNDFIRGAMLFSGSRTGKGRVEGTLAETVNYEEVGFGFLLETMNEYSLNSGDKIERDIARTMLEIASPIPDTPYRLLTSPLALKIASLDAHALLVRPDNPEDHKLITELYKLAAKSPDDVITKIRESAPHREALYRFESLLKDIRAKQIAGENYEKVIGNSGHTVIITPTTKIIAGAYSKCANPSFAVKEDFTAETLTAPGRHDTVTYKSVFKESTEVVDPKQSKRFKAVNLALAMEKDDIIEPPETGVKDPSKTTKVEEAAGDADAEVIKGLEF